MQENESSEEYLPDDDPDVVAGMLILAKLRSAEAETIDLAQRPRPRLAPPGSAIDNRADLGRDGDD